MEQLGPYVLETRIARGGMGEIYRASLQRSAGFQRTVAVKRILPHLSDDATFIRMFETEARLTALLSHPNIVHMYDFGKDDGTVWLAMEYVDGIDVRRLFDACLAAREEFPLGIALHIAEQCARGLQYAHTLVGTNGPLHIVHRDISPQNILVSIQGETKLTDFGLAKALAADPGSMSGMMKGKLGYMSPEQVQGKAVTPQTDIFGLGAVLYELVSGRRVYPVGDGLAALVARATHANIQPLTTDEAPQAVVDIVTRCLQKLPELRYRSAAELASDLGTALVACGEGSVLTELGQLVRTHQRMEIAGQGTNTAGPMRTAVAARPAREILPDRASDEDRRDTDSITPLLPSRDKPRPPSSDSSPGLELAETAIGVPSASLEEVPPDNDSWSASAVDDASDVLTETEDKPRFSWALGIVGGLLVLGAVFLTMRPSHTVPLVTDSVTDAIRLVAEARSSAANQPTVSSRDSQQGVSRRGRRIPDISSVGLKADTYGALQVTVSGVASAQCFAWSELRQQQRKFVCGDTVRLPGGPWRILAKSERGERTQDVVIVAGQPTQALALHWEKEPVRCSLSIASTPPGATVAIDGDLLESATPLTADISAGTHLVVIEKRGRKTIRQEVTCDSKPVALEVSLERPSYIVSVGRRKRRVQPGGSKRWTIARTDGGRATLRVKVSPSGAGTAVLDASPYAQVVVNGRARGVTPVRGIQLPLGRRTTVLLKRDGMQVGRAIVSIQSDNRD